MSPAELLIGRRLRGRLDLLKHQSGKNDDDQGGSNPEAKVSDSQARQKRAHDKGTNLTWGTRYG